MRGVYGRTPPRDTDAGAARLRAGAGRPFTRPVAGGMLAALTRWHLPPPAQGVPRMIGRLVRVLASLFAALLVFAGGAAVDAKAAGRQSTMPDPDADEIDLV